MHLYNKDVLEAYCTYICLLEGRARCQITFYLQSESHDSTRNPNQLRRESSGLVASWMSDHNTYLAQ